MTTRPTILLIDGKKHDRQRSKERFGQHLDAGARFVEANDIKEALSVTNGHEVDFVIVSRGVGDFELEALNDLANHWGPVVVPVILELEEDGAVARKALEAGAHDIIFRNRHGGTDEYRAFRNALEITKARRELERQRQALDGRSGMTEQDAVTNLPTRREMRSRLSMALSAAADEQLTGVMLIGLDDFKAINSTLGHGAGEELLRMVVDRLRHCVRNSDTMARWSGDEFAVVLEEMSRPEDAVIIAQRVIHALSRPFAFKGQDIYITASVGISIHPADGEDGETLLRNADAAMYRVKSSGGNNYEIYSVQMNEKLSDRLHLGSRLRSALEQEEFVLHYQPQLDVQNGSVIGVEALLRWHDPIEGMRSPADFIPILEETGLIVPVGEWVLRKACTQARAWQFAGLSKLRVAVNLSPRQFRQRELVGKVRNVLEETGLDPDLLELELTESALMDDQDYAQQVLTELKGMGPLVALDDFGTGYSSLALLKAFPVDTLKIDRAFIRGIAADEDDRSICSAIVTLGQALRLHVLAEGVEDREQVEILKRQGCHYAQGFLYARPMPADDVWSWLTADVASSGD